MKMKWDGHTHSNFCPHGSQDTLDAYIEQAIQKGFNRISITEHAPLPASFTDPTPLRDSAMEMEQLEAYFRDCQRVKEKYKAYIEIKVGLEVDYLFGFEGETKAFLDKVGNRLDDAILSLHFLPSANEWICLDYSPEEFEKLIEAYGSVDQLYAYYYELLLEAVKADLGMFKPNRIGHFTLIEKFKLKFPSLNKQIWWDKALAFLKEVKQRGYQLDFNTAGLQKPLCRDIYPSEELLNVAKKLAIPFVYGSDAHQAKHVGSHYQQFIQQCL